MKPKIYLKDYNGVLKTIRASDEFEFVLDPRDADCLVLWQDIRGDMLELCNINKQHIHKPIVVIQHGLGATRDYQAPENFPLLADKYCCWSENDKTRLERAGYGDRAVVTGSPLINSLIPWEEHPDKNIIFCPVIAMHEEPANLITFYELKKAELEYNQKMLRESEEGLRGQWNWLVLDGKAEDKDNIPYHCLNSKFRIISKLTNLHDKNLYMGSVSMTVQNSKTHIDDCMKLLSQTDVVVGMVEGTFQSLAMAMDIPVVICRGWEFSIYGGKDYSKSELIKTDGVTYCDVGDLKKTVEAELANPKRLSEQRKQAVLRDFGDISSNPTAKIIETIKGVING